MANSIDSGGTPGSKQLKVDNWGTFFIHRLQMLYDKNDYCDVTLKFHDGGEIKVHKLVLLACTDYFQNLTMTPDNTLVLPPVLKHNNVLPIVNFMYTGKLDFKYESSQNIVNAAKLLNMTLLVKLLNAQIKKEGSAVGVSSPSTTVTKSYVKKVTTSPTSSTTPTSTLPGKKLPFWKKRTKPGHLLDEFQPEVKSPRLAPLLEDAKPTRFEWPEETDVKPSPVMLYSPSFDYISYDSELMVKPVDLKKPLEALENNEREIQNSESFTENLKGLKTNNVVEHCFGMESDDDDDDDGHFESVHNVDPYDDDDDPPEENGNDVTGHNNTESGYKINEITELPPNVNPISTKCSTTSSTTVSTPKPILKPLTSDLSTSSNQSKKVRFSLSSEGKENANKTPEKQIVVQNSSPSVEKISQKITTPSKPTSSKSKKTNSINSTNHAKIIAEVLKKYPELVKNNKNIRLKIMAPNNKVGSVKSPASQPLPKCTSSGKSKVSYVVIKSELNNQQEETVVVSTPSSGAENTTGPWFCYTCGSNSEPLNFETYYLYRRHLQDVHMERIDARICEHCGYKSSKRNLHLYHLYTKHQIQPPRNTNFPKCDQCDYIALSDSLLMKHRNNHVGPKKDYNCKVCTAGFKSYGALQGHMQTSLHSENSNKEYQCEFCEKVFNRNINLKAHIRTVHKDESRKLYDEEDTTPQQNLLQVIQVPVIESLQNNLKGPQTLLLPPGMTLLAESPGVPLLQSSESEALNSVASGIATSLNLNETNLMSDQTVIFLDTNSELLFDQSGNPLVMAETTVMTDESSGEVQEYIIPEMIATTNSMSQVFTTQASPVVTTTAEMVPISVCNQPQQQEQQLLVENPDVPSSDHTYADESSQLAEGEVEENSEQVGANDATDNLTTTEEPSSASVQVPEMNNLQDIVPPEQSHVTVDHDPLSRSVETIQFAASNSNNTTEITNQPMEVCERDSIIIQPPSVIQQPNVTVSSHSTCLLDEDVVVQIGNNSSSLQCINSNSVIVSAAQTPMFISPKKHAKDELVEDWDDFDDEDVENTGSCSLGEMETNDDQADDIRPSRPTIELEESILPDM